MKPPRFDYAEPSSLDEALAALAQYGPRAQVMAGGQSLAAMLNMRLLSPDIVLDISRLPELQQISESVAGIQVGAGVTQQQLLLWPGLAAAQPLLAQLLPWVGHDQTRTRGTICGSLVHADPSSELPLALALLDGEVTLSSRTGERILNASQFHTGLMTTALAPDELLTAVRFPKAGGASACAFTEVAERHGDFALVAIGAVADANSVRIGIAGVTDRPTVFTLAWQDESILQQQLHDIASHLDASDDHHASAQYRRALVARLGLRLILEVRNALSEC